MDNNLHFNHIGAAVSSLDKTIDILKNYFECKPLSNIVFDPIQKVNLALINIGGVNIELVSGKKVSRFLVHKCELNFYHICFEVKNFNKTIEKYNKTEGLIMVAPPVPAILFNNRQIAFFIKKDIGLVEILGRR